MSRRDTALKYFDENEDFMHSVVEPSIERNRKGKGFITIVDGEGHPIDNAKISVVQKSHEFKYGANIFMLDEMETDEKNQAYKDAFKDLFNIATLPFYWSDLERVQGQPRYTADSPKIYRRPATDLCVDFCLKNGIEPKCHCLNYEAWIPKWLLDSEVDHHKKMLEKRFRELSERYADVIPSWEVTNETLTPDDEYYTEFSKFYKEDDFVEWSFRMADRYFPNNRLIINDFYQIWEPFRNNRSQYFMQIERLVRNGIAHLDSIGMQFHSFFPKDSEGKMAKTRYNPVHLYKVLDKYAQLGKKIQITEMTIPAYSNDTEDEDVQAELIEKIYTVFFSHPAMEAIVYWNLVDGYAAAAKLGDMTRGENIYHGGLMNFDLSKKKAYHVLKKLFSEKWHTEESGTTTPDGKFNFSGFYGDYNVEITHNGKTINKEIRLSQSKNNLIKIMI